MSEKIGIMGGTFNPVHLGHLILAESAFVQLNLNKVLFMPSKNPPHKEEDEIVSDDIRMEMIKLAIHKNEHFETSDLELKRDGITYTSDTLEILHQKEHDSEYYFIMGADSLFNIEKWYRPKLVMDLCTIVAANRDMDDLNRIQKQSELLKIRYNAKIVILNMPQIEISSSQIRESIQKGCLNRYFLPRKVYKYIMENKLYNN